MWVMSQWRGRRSPDVSVSAPLQDVTFVPELRMNLSIRAGKQQLRELAIVRCFLSDINCKNVLLAR